MDVKNEMGLAVGHIVLNVASLEVSVKFFEALGLSALVIPEESLAIIELAGGTHVLLFEHDPSAAHQPAESRYGQLGKTTGETIDLMIQSKSRDDLESYRKRLVELGVEAEEIHDEVHFGHYIFAVKDPDGHKITIYTSHAFE